MLDTFALSFNLFKGTIPDFMWEFEDMVYMDLAYNFFTGTVPEIVYAAEPKLRVLFVDYHGLSLERSCPLQREEDVPRL